MDEERDLMFPEWQAPYLLALTPGPPETLHERVEYAEKAILVRLADLVSSAEREIEIVAIKHALDALYVIKIQQLDFPYCTPGPSKAV